MARLLDLFCGRWGWSKAFAARGWQCLGIDLVEPSSSPANCDFYLCDVLKIDDAFIRGYAPDFICGSPPCEQFSIHGMRNFHPDPPPPTLGIKLFMHSMKLCEASGIPHVLENVRRAQDFVGLAKLCCGPFALWGTGVPPILPQGINKGFGKFDREFILKIGSSKSKKRMEHKARVAEIPPMLANAVANYAEGLLEMANG